jgi:hypothetical protein
LPDDWASAAVLPSAKAVTSAIVLSCMVCFLWCAPLRKSGKTQLVLSWTQAEASTSMVATDHLSAARHCRRGNCYKGPSLSSQSSMQKARAQSRKGLSGGAEALCVTGRISHRGEVRCWSIGVTDNRS